MLWAWHEPMIDDVWVLCESKGEKEGPISSESKESHDYRKELFFIRAFSFSIATFWVRGKGYTLSYACARKNASWSCQINILRTTTKPISHRTNF